LPVIQAFGFAWEQRDRRSFNALAVIQAFGALMRSSGSTTSFTSGFNALPVIQAFSTPVLRMCNRCNRCGRKGFNALPVIQAFGQARLCRIVNQHTSQFQCLAGHSGLRLIAEIPSPDCMSPRFQCLAGHSGLRLRRQYIARFLRVSLSSPVETPREASKRMEICDALAENITQVIESTSLPGVCARRSAREWLSVDHTCN